jgi:hypothetical protein
MAIRLDHTIVPAREVGRGSIPAGDPPHRPDAASEKCARAVESGPRRSTLQRRRQCAGRRGTLADWVRPGNMDGKGGLVEGHGPDHQPACAVHEWRRVERTSIRDCRSRRSKGADDVE